MVKKVKYLVLVIGLLSSCGNPERGIISDNSESIKNPTNRVLLSSDIKWEKLNPARGDQSPQAGTIWGDRRGKVPTGFLAKFVDGFSSPPHIHNVTYRAVVIKGLVHNDDPGAGNMWMKTGSFWTQPAGEIHITSAKGKENIALVEIDSGPYLVKQVSEAFDSGGRPINIEASNIIWLSHKKTTWVNSNSKGEISFLSENNDLKSLFIKLPKDYKGEIETEGKTLHSVVVKGVLNYIMPQNEEAKVLDVGSYFGATDKAMHKITNKSDEEVILYVRTNGAIKVN